LVRKIKTLIKNEVGMNYYFTGVLIIMMCLLAFCVGPITY